MHPASAERCSAFLVLLCLLLLSLAVPVEGGPGAPSTLVEGVGSARAVVVPWIAQADPGKALRQESDLYVHNPGPGSLVVDVTFRKQGLPEADPPRVTLILGELETVYLPNVLVDLFARHNVAGYVIAEVTEGTAQPLVLSFNRTFGDGRVFGQTVPGVSLEEDGNASRGDIFHLVGLQATAERIGYLGVTNPVDAPLRFRLRAFDRLGQQLASPSPSVTVPRFGQKQFRIEELRHLFGLDQTEDYRVAIELTSRSRRAVPYGANLRWSSRDPSFLRSGRTDVPEVFFLDVLNTPGLNDSFFQTDLVVANTGSEPVTPMVTFTGAGVLSEPTEPMAIPIPAGETVRLEDVIWEWQRSSVVGVLRMVTEGGSAPYPVAQAESYDVSDPERTYGQFMPALTIEDAARPDRPRSLIGLRQDAGFQKGVRSTVWLYNPGDSVASYTLRYLDHAGTELGTIEGRLGAGKLRQVNAGAHPLPPGGAPEGFVVRLEVSDGALLMAGQVVNESNDSAYVVAR